MTALSAILDSEVLQRHRERTLARLHSVDDFRRAARRRLPPMVFDFVDGGAEGEVTLRANEAMLEQLWFRPRPLVDVSHPAQAVELFGRSIPMPLMLAPAGLAGLVWPAGEVAAARAASAAGVPFVVSTASSCSIEDVRRAADGPLWFQLYLWRDREMTGSLVDRAAAAGYEALCLTVDVPLSGMRLRDLRNGMTIPPRIGPRNALGVLSRPGWIARSLSAPVVTFANVSGGRSGRTVALGTYVNSQLNPAASWDDLRWLRDRWPGKLLAKGVLDGEAAARMVDEGIDGIVVSNHGGRQLDGALPAIAALPGVVTAVGGRVPVLMDGGIRRGSDVVKAMALGARACLMGRPYLWGLSVAGEAGVGRVLALLRADVERSLALLGVADASDLWATGGAILATASPELGVRSQPHELSDR